MTELENPESANADQVEYWNTGPGAKWAAHQETLDAMMASILDRLLTHAAPKTGERVLDIGCGAGASSLALASQVGTGGQVLGIDIARPLLDKAETRTAEAGLGNVRYLVADAQTHNFEAGAFDLMTSRFGVMFFADPLVAFGNIATALRPGGRMAFVSWASLQANPWFQMPRAAAIARLGPPEATPANAPGPMAFQDTAYVSEFLSKAGLSDVSAQVEELRLTISGSLDEVAEFASSLGPATRVINEMGGTTEDVAAITRDIAKGLEDYKVDGGVSVPATLNFYSAVRR